MSKSKQRTTRSMLQRVQAIFEIINVTDEPFAKSNLTKANISPKAVDNWLDLIVYIQNQPRIKVTKTKYHTIVEKRDVKRSNQLLNRFLDDKLSISSRIKSLTAYRNVILHKEFSQTENMVYDDLVTPGEGLRSSWVIEEEISHASEEDQKFARDFLKKNIPSIRKIIDVYQESARDGRSHYMKWITIEKATLQLIARNLKDFISVSKISPRLLTDPLPLELIYQQFTTQEEETFITSYLAAIFMLVYCVSYGLEGWELSETIFNEVYPIGENVKKISMLTPILQLIEEKLD